MLQSEVKVDHEDDGYDDGPFSVEVQMPVC